MIMEGPKIYIKKDHLFILIIQTFMISVFARTNIHFGYTFISLQNVLILLFTPILIIYLFKKFPYVFQIKLFLIMLYFLTITFYIIAYFRDIEQIKDYFYSFSFISIFVLFAYGFQYYRIHLWKALYNVLFIIFIALAVIVIYEITTLNHLPFSRGNLSLGENLSAKYKYIPTATFYNANDLAAHVILFFPLLFISSYFYGSIKQRFIIIASTIILLLGPMSRSAFAAFLLFPLLLYFIKGKYIRFISLLLLFVGIFFFLRSLDLNPVKNTGTLTISYNRIVSFINIDESIESGGSVSSRLDVYRNLFNSLDDFFLQGKGFQAENLIYEQKANDQKANHPHSLIVELIINFGILGSIPFFLILLIPFFYALINFNKNWINRYALVQILYIILFIHIPASVMRYPALWIALSIIYCFLFLEKKHLIQSHNIINSEYSIRLINKS